MSNRLGGKQGTAYTGTNANQPPNWNFNDRDPNQFDTQNVSIGDLWLNTTNDNVWILVSLQGNANSRGALALWIMFAGGFGNVISLTSNSGGPVFPLLGNINVVGDGVTITGVGNPATNTITFSLIGGQAAVDSLTGNSGGAVFPAANGNINVVGSGVITVVGNPGANTLTITPSGDIASSFITNPATGTATPAAGVLTFTNGNNITMSAGGSAVTVNVSGTTNHTVQVGNASGSLTSIANGTTGQYLTAQTGADPIWSTFSPLAASNSFFAYVPVDIPNWIGGTVIQIIPYSAILFNNGGNYNSGTYTYTCPATGLYCFQITFGLRLLEVTSTALSVSLTTSAAGQIFIYDNFNPFAYATNTGDTAIAVNSFYFIPLTAGDTVFPGVNLIGTQAVNITLLGQAAHFYRNTFSGFRVA